MRNISTGTGQNVPDVGRTHSPERGRESCMEVPLQDPRGHQAEGGREASERWVFPFPACRQETRNLSQVEWAARVGKCRSGIPSPGDCVTRFLGQPCGCGRPAGSSARPWCASPHGCRLRISPRGCRRCPSPRRDESLRVCCFGLKRLRPPRGRSTLPCGSQAGGHQGRVVPKPTSQCQFQQAPR